MNHSRIFLLALVISLWPVSVLAAERSPSRVEETSFVSQHLQGNLIGIDPTRKVSVYLPPGYDQSGKAYPVIYYFHSLFWSPRQMFEDGVVRQRFDEAIASGAIDDFIVVAADFSAPPVGTFFGNAEPTGRWLDLIVEELVPFVDRTYRTLPTRESRGLLGEAIGGYAVLKLAMLHPELADSIYALHPFGTGSGLIPMTSGTRPDWRRMSNAKSWEDLDGDATSMVFTAMAQAHLPNPNRPPFYCDWIMEVEGDELVVNDEHVRDLHARFFLDHLLPEHATSLKKVSGIKMDWGRYDPVQSHVYSNQAFSRKLDEYGVSHEAEEYGGAQWDKNWLEHGRVAMDVMPFFNRFLKSH